MTKSLHDRLQEAVRDATLQRRRDELRVLRMVVAEVKQAQIDQRLEPNDQNLSTILARMVKQRRDSERLFREADRKDLADQELFEINIILDFLPEQISGQALEDAVTKVIDETSANGMKDMGKVMGQLKGMLEGQADMAAVSQIVRAKLSSS